MTRPTWPSIWMGLARSLAARSVDPRLQVGCVIVSYDDRRVLGVGYNGDETGGSHEPDSLEPGQSGFIHAEVNAMIKAGGCRAATVYVTHAPCPVCARALVNERVARVVYAAAYRDMRGVQVLTNAGIIVEELKDG